MAFLASHNALHLGDEPCTQIIKNDATSTLPLSHGDTLSNTKHCLHNVQQGRNSEYPLIRTCISYKEYSQAMLRDLSRKTLCLRDPV